MPITRFSLSLAGPVTGLPNYNPVFTKEAMVALLVEKRQKCLRSLRASMPQQMMQSCCD